MYWLVLVSFLELQSIKPAVIAPPFKDRDACLAQASRLNKVDPLDAPRKPGHVFVCLSLVYPS